MLLTTCYIQGVGNLWTDPQIHSLAGDDYGDGNLGVGGMALFFSTSRYGPVAKSLGLPLFALSAAEQARFEMPPSHTVAACLAYGCSLHRIRLQPPSHAVAGSIAYGCSLHHIRLQPPSHAVAASITYGCSPPHMRLQPASHAVAACLTCGCSVHHIRLQARIEAHQEQLAASDPASAEGAPYLAPTQVS